MQHFQIVKIIRKELNNKPKPGTSAYFDKVVEINSGKMVTAGQRLTFNLQLITQSSLSSAYQPII